jgi:hypothetical protein
LEGSDDGGFGCWDESGSLFAVLINFRHNPIKVVASVNDEDAVKVVNFVLEDASEPPFGLNDDFVAVSVKGFDANFQMAVHFCLNPWD